MNVRAGAGGKMVDLAPEQTGMNDLGGVKLVLSLTPPLPGV